ncbi:MAG: glutamate-5-semialdehyde dehydrogenase [Tissierellia bacterium]|nr:glutamate-5-semialdehyde dehydrogenase [Tissierellia bacterium]
MITSKGILLKEGQKSLSAASTRDKNKALELVHAAVEKNKKKILRANQEDLEEGRKNQMSAALLDRLALDDERMGWILDGIKTVAKLDDPVWQSSSVTTLENGLTITKMAVPLGVIGIIYESRPNVTVDAFSLALKSGNGILLRGSSSALRSNKALVEAIKEGLAASPISPEVIQFIDDPDRSHVEDMLRANDILDLIIPRGGAGLINFVIANSSVPTLQTGEGNCHTFVDASADLDKALKILVNAKAQRLGVCNTCETLLVHKDVARDFLPRVEEVFRNRIELRACDKSREFGNFLPASEEDYATEFLDAILAIKVVDSLDEAIDHVNKYGTMHSEAIVTESLTSANRFQREVDAAVVYVNASTRFTDGAEFGYGAEMGISTQKIHARGPVGLQQLTTYKYLVMGQGQIRE